jgi:hypothetical protein
MKISTRLNMHSFRPTPLSVDLPQSNTSLHYGLSSSIYAFFEYLVVPWGSIILQGEGRYPIQCHWEREVGRTNRI